MTNKTFSRKAGDFVHDAAEGIVSTGEAVVEKSKEAARRFSEWTKDSLKGPFLTPKTQHFVDDLKEQDAPPIQTLDIEAAREVLLDAQSHPNMRRSANIQDHQLPIGANRRLDVRFVRPEGKQQDLPLIFYLHGGGWILGDVNTHDRLIRELANEVGAVVAFPSYSRSPEVRYPVALEECYAALIFILDHADQFDINSQRVAVAGDSAGGNLATALTMLIKERAGPKVDFQLLFYPVTDSSMDTETYTTFFEGPWLSKAAMQWYWNAYAPGTDRQDVTASPLRAEIEQLRDLPPALIITAENDPLRSEGEAYAHKLMKAGVPTTSVRYLGTIHDFVMLDALAESAPSKAAMSQACAALWQTLHH